MSLIGLIADAHGNAPALEAVLASLSRGGIDEVWSAGDLVGYNSMVAESIEMHRKEAFQSVQGNHDLFMASPGEVAHAEYSDLAASTLNLTRALLNDSQLSFLGSLPATIEKAWPCGEVLMVHGLPMDPIWGRLEPENVGSVQVPNGVRVVVSGAVHRSYVVESSGVKFVNPGSVGMPRDGDPRASYATIDTKDGTVTHHRVYYDPTSLAFANSASGIPAAVNDRLFFGGPTPGHVSLQLEFRSTLDEAAARLSGEGLAVARPGPGIVVGVDRPASGNLVIAAALDGGSMLIRTSPVPTDGVTDDPDIVPLFANGRGLRWLEVVLPLEEGGGALIASWCRRLDEAYGSLVEGRGGW